MSPQSIQIAEQGVRKLALVPIIFVLLRIWGTIRFTLFAANVCQTNRTGSAPYFIQQILFTVQVRLSLTLVVPKIWPLKLVESVVQSLTLFFNLHLADDFDILWARCKLWEQRLFLDNTYSIAFPPLSNIILNSFLYYMSIPLCFINWF